MSSRKLLIVGSGNVAWHLSKALEKSGHQVLAVWSRTLGHASRLASQLYAAQATDSHDLSAFAADIAIVCVPDDGIAPLTLTLSLPKNILLVHTSGATPIQALTNPYTHRLGVLYPLQTFSKSKPVDLKNVPICIEATSAEDEAELERLAGTISDTLAVLSSQDRVWLHVAAVFACNFSNHMYSIAHQLLSKQGIPFEILHPLMRETTQKALQHPPRSVQTGPAARGDAATLDLHTSLLQASPWADLYQQISQSILREISHTSK